MTSPQTTAIIDQASAAAREYLLTQDVDLTDPETIRVIRKVNAWYLAHWCAARANDDDYVTAWALAIESMCLVNP